MGALHLRSCIFVTLTAIAFKVCSSTSTTCRPDRSGCGPAGGDDDLDDQLTLLQSRPASRKAKPVEDTSTVESTYVGERAAPSANQDPDLTKTAVELEAGMAVEEHSRTPPLPPAPLADAPQPPRDEPQSKAGPPPPPPGAPATTNDALMAEADADPAAPQPGAPAATNDAPAANADAGPASPAPGAPAANDASPVANADAGPASPAPGAPAANDAAPVANAEAGPASPTPRVPAANDAAPVANADTTETAAKDVLAKTHASKDAKGIDSIDEAKLYKNADPDPKAKSGSSSLGLTVFFGVLVVAVPAVA